MGNGSVERKEARDLTMGILAWIIFGFIVGLIARWIVPGGTSGGILVDIVVGVIGALLGGWIYGFFFNHVGVTGFNLPSIVCAIIGAVVLLFILRAVRGRPAV